MDYGKIKQGTIIHGLRSEQYPDEECSAIIITAECDIAQCKVSKFYYLTAMDVRTWIETEGFSYTTANMQLGKLKKFIERFRDKIPGLMEYQNAATVNLEEIKADIEALPEGTNTCEAIKELLEIEKLQASKKNVLEKLKLILKGDLTQFFFLPRSTYMVKGNAESKPEDSYEGLIVNFQDINFFDATTVAMIERQKMDFEKLSAEERDRYGKVFFLQEKGDMIFPEEIVSSPYRERLMQAFSFAFIRIGVEFDSKEAQNYWDRSMQTAVQ